MLFYGIKFQKKRIAKAKQFSQLDKDVSHWLKNGNKTKYYIAVFLDVRDGKTLDEFTDKVLKKIPKEKLKKYNNMADGYYYSLSEYGFDVKKYNLSGCGDLAFIYFTRDGNIFTKDGHTVFYGEKIWSPQEFELLINELIS